MRIWAAMNTQVWNPREMFLLLIHLESQDIKGQVTPILPVYQRRGHFYPTVSLVPGDLFLFMPVADPDLHPSEGSGRWMHCLEHSWIMVSSSDAL